MAGKKEIDIPLDGVGVSGPSAVRRSKIDIPLDGERPGRTGQSAQSISELELEIVNRHHAEVKEMHRRAREGR